jgi:hypothetical protein
MTLYAKSIAAIIAAALGILVTALSDDALSPAELTNVTIAIVTAIGVFLVPTLPAGPARYTKFAVALLGAALITLSSLLDGGVTTSEWLQVALSALAAVGVYVVPNTPMIDAGTHVPGTPVEITHVNRPGVNMTEQTVGRTAAAALNLQTGRE